MAAKKRSTKGESAGEAMTQMERLAEHFPTETHARVNKGGREQTYIPWTSSVERLNDVLGPHWSFRVVREGLTDTEAYVLGEIKAIVDGVEVVRQHFGCETIKRGKEGKPITDLFKIAASDAIWKAASMLGVGLYLSIKEERQYIEYLMQQVVKEAAAAAKDAGKPNTPSSGASARACKAITGHPDPESVCGESIPEGPQLLASMKEFDKPLCADHLSRARDWREERERRKATLEVVGNDSQDAPESPPEAPTSTATTKPTVDTPAPSEAPKQTKYPCEAKIGPKDQKTQCPAVMRLGTGESYNGRTIRADKVIEDSQREFQRVLCGKHLHEAQQFRKRKAEQAAAGVQQSA
jgi:hypothetical protein